MKLICNSTKKILTILIFTLFLSSLAFLTACSNNNENLSDLEPKKVDHLPKEDLMNIPTNFLNADCDDIINSNELNSILNKEWTWVKTTKYNNSGTGIICLFGDKEGFSKKEGGIPALHINVRTAYDKQTPEEFAESLKQLARINEKIEITNEVGSIYFSYTDYYANTLSQFVTSNKRYRVSLAIYDRSIDADYEEIKPLNGENAVKISKIINNNLDQI